jgi:hypothetical protein
MHIVAVCSWQQEEDAVAATIAEILGILVFEARQKIAGGGPAVLASFADPKQAETLAARLSQASVPALVIDSAVVRQRKASFPVRRFVLGAQALQLESFAAEPCEIAYGTIELLLVATCSSGEKQTTATVTERKFSIGKTLLAGGVPMTKKVTREETVPSTERDETLWLYARGRATVVFSRGTMSYDGLDEAMQVSRDLNFGYLKNALRRLAPQATYNDRLLKRAALVKVLGPALSPEADLDLAFEILARSLRENP